jgi:REP element-mobilizing transposase RayT
MRRARLTYPGAFHHVMNRGIKGEYIFPDDGDKKVFLEILSEKTNILGVRLLGYCIMNNHYHLLLENSSGRMSALLKQVNGSYGIYYRRKHGGKGYVFQSRFKSTLIQDDTYLRLAILYLLQNPVRAGLVTNSIEYQWSSAGEYLQKTGKPITDVPFVHELWNGKKFMIKELTGTPPAALPINKSDFGDVLGEYEFLAKALEKRDKRSNEKSLERRRQDDSYFEPVEKIYWELEKAYGKKFDRIDFGTLAGKQRRGELLVRLKELSGLTYREIAQLNEFADIKMYSLAKLYKDARKRIAAKKS